MVNIALSYFLNGSFSVGFNEFGALIYGVSWCFNFLICNLEENEKKNFMV